MESTMAPMSHLLNHGGMTVRDWFSEMLHTVRMSTQIRNTRRVNSWQSGVGGLRHTECS